MAPLFGAGLAAAGPPGGIARPPQPGAGAQQHQPSPGGNGPSGPPPTPFGPGVVPVAGATSVMGVWTLGLGLLGDRESMMMMTTVMTMIVTLNEL